jgi:hypothetical protein
VALPCVSSPCEELPETVSTSSMGVFCLRGCLAVDCTRVTSLLLGRREGLRQGILELGSSAVVVVPGTKRVCRLLLS